MIIASFILLNCYIIVLFILYKGFQRLLGIPTKAITPVENLSVYFTIVIPFRNEAENLPKLITSLNALEFSRDHFEIILINDDSTDTSVQKINNLIDSEISYTILENIHRTNSPKKDAITLAISKAKGNWIITTDADCEVPPLWLQQYFIAIETFDPKMLCAPVMIAENDNFIAQFQQADILSLQGVTMGSFGVGNPLLCNGANLAFDKNAFYEVNGYDGNTQVASGDDIFMLQKMIVEFPDKVHYLKATDAVVLTQPVAGWKALINQRIRWASKTTQVKNMRATLLGLLVFTVNSGCLVFLFLGLFGVTEWYVSVLFFLIKISADFIFISKIKRWFKISVSVNALLKSGFIYPFVTCFVAIKSISKQYTWKDRTY